MQDIIKSVLIFLQLCFVIQQQLGDVTAMKVNSEGREFCIAMMIEPLKGNFFTKFVSRYIMIATTSPSPVNFTVVYSKPGMEEQLVYSSHQTVLNDPYTESSIGMLGNMTVDNDEFENRNKGICITSESDVYVVSYLKDRVNYKHSSSFLALPYQELLTDQYEYYIMSASCEYDKYFSGFIVVGLRNDTSITLYPSIPLSIIEDTQSISSAHVDVQPGQHHTVILHRRQTLFIGKDGGADVTGTRVVSNKPLTVLSGHESGSIPTHGGTYEPMLQQIPPTQLWGDKFMIVPYYDFPLGQVIKVLSSVDNIEISYNCYQFSNETILPKAGNVHQFFMPSNASCYIEANNSVLVGQFPYSLSGNRDGDTTMILVASIDQYPNKLEFTTLTSNHYISIIVSVGHNSTPGVLYDGNSTITKWTPVYDSHNHTIGYGYGSTIGKGHHTLVNVDNDERVFAMVYGFYIGKAYGFPAGFEFPSNKALGVYFSSSEYTVHEGDGSVSIELQRRTHINYTDYYHFNTTDDSSTDNSIRYVPVSKDIVFYPMQSSLSVPIVIKDNSVTEPNEHFTVQLCHTADPLRGLCIQAKVTIMDDLSPSKATTSSTYTANTASSTVTPAISNNNNLTIYIAVSAVIGAILLIACAVGIIISGICIIIRIRSKHDSQFQYRFLSMTTATNSSFTDEDNDSVETNKEAESTDSEPLQDDDPEETARL